MASTKTVGKDAEGNKKVIVEQQYQRVPEPERRRTQDIAEISAKSHRISALASAAKETTDFGKWVVPGILTFFGILLLAGPTLMAILKLGAQLNYIYIMIFLVLGIWLWRRWE